MPNQITVNTDNNQINIDEGGTRVITIVGAGPQGPAGPSGSQGPSGSLQDTGSLLTTASISDAIVTFTKGDGSTFDIEVNNVSSSISSSYALTASYAENAGGSSDPFPYTGSAIVSGSLIITGSTDISGSVTASSITTPQGTINQLTSSYAITASYAENAGGSSDPFPYTGSAIVSGSLIITGSTDISGSVTASYGKITNFTASIARIDTMSISLIESTYNNQQIDLLGGNSILQNISASGYISASQFVGNGSALTNLQRPISSSVTTNITASNINAGYFFEVAGNVTCSIQSSSIVPNSIGNEYEFFQSGSGNFLFETGSGVTMYSKNGLKLSAEFSACTLKHIRQDVWVLVGDLTT